MRLVLALCLLLAACGGGGGGGSAPVSGPVSPPPAPRTDLWFAYFGHNAISVNETAQHTNLLWAADWAGVSEQIAALTHAKAGGITNAILMVPAYTMDPSAAEGEVRFWLQRLDNLGLLDIVIALAPIDEPNTPRAGNRTDAEVTAKNAMLRRVMEEFPRMKDRKLAVIYACNGDWPGIRSYDLIGCDHYDRGCGVLRGYYDELRGLMTQEQRLILVVGGASPWRQDPACFASYADSTPQVKLLLAFIWQTVTDEGNTYAGIRDNGMRKPYCDTGRVIVGRAGPC